MKLRNKLILSCAALAAVASTAVSTTFAWYTSNKTVTASGIQASSEDSGAKLLMIADGLKTNGELEETAKLSWQTKITDLHEYQPTNGMVPLSWNGNSLQALDTSTSKTGADPENHADASGYLHFVIYLRNASTGADADVSMTFTTLDNVAANHTDAMTFANLPTRGVVKGETYTNRLSTSSNANYKVDATRVLAVNIEKTIVGDTTTTSETTHKFVKNAYLTGDNDAATVSGGSAVAYYNDVMQPATALDATSDTTKGTGAFGDSITVGTAVSSFVTVPSDKTGDASKYVKLDFKVYLDGWDANCYDACQGQYFNFALSFTAA